MGFISILTNSLWSLVELSALTLRDSKSTLMVSTTLSKAFHTVEQVNVKKTTLIGWLHPYPSSHNGCLPFCPQVFLSSVLLELNQERKRWLDKFLQQQKVHELLTILVHVLHALSTVCTNSILLKKLISFTFFLCMHCLNYLVHCIIQWVHWNIHPTIFTNISMWFIEKIWHFTFPSTDDSTGL